MSLDDPSAAGLHRCIHVDLQWPLVQGGGRGRGGGVYVFIFPKSPKTEVRGPTSYSMFTSSKSVREEVCFFAYCPGWAGPACTTSCPQFMASTWSVVHMVFSNFSPDSTEIQLPLSFKNQSPVGLWKTTPPGVPAVSHERPDAAARVFKEHSTDGTSTQLSNIVR